MNHFQELDLVAALTPAQEQWLFNQVEKQNRISTAGKSHLAMMLALAGADGRPLRISTRLGPGGVTTQNQERTDSNG